MIGMMIGDWGTREWGGLCGVGGGGRGGGDLCGWRVDGEGGEFICVWDVGGLDQASSIGISGSGDSGFGQTCLDCRDFGVQMGKAGCGHCCAISSMAISLLISTNPIPYFPTHPHTLPGVWIA